MSDRWKLIFVFLVLLAVGALLLAVFTQFFWGGAIAGCIGIALALISLLVAQPGGKVS